MAESEAGIRGFTRIDSDFLSDGTRCAGWLYLPERAKSPPVVILGHGFAAERTFRLDAYAERFVGEGIAAFAFDYRYFGDSGGEPRQLISPQSQLDDWKAAIAHVRTIEGIDRDRIALWGSSFGGGHVIMTAADDPGIAAIVSQVPLVDSLAAGKNVSTRDRLRCLMAGVRDLFRDFTFRSPYYVPVVGEPGDFALMTAPGFKSGYLGIVPEGSSWKNETPARVFFSAAIYRPITRARKVKCPALVVLGEQDSGSPPESVEKAAARMQHARLLRMPFGHFDVYTGEGFETVAAVEADFLKEHLLRHSD